MFPYPNWLQNHHFSGGISALCCSKNDSFRRLSGKWPSWEAQFHITIDFACILDRIFAISRLILLQFVKKTLPVLVAKHSTFGEAITAWHEACVGTFTHAYPYSAKINANYPPLQRLFFRCRVLCLLGGPLDHGVFSLLLLRTGYVVCISARCRPPAVANFASHAAFRQSAP